ncbi:MAG TPA: glutamate-1-semialdehyde 2,1-aminomutase [Myxococcales bacterium]|nr:glutamate-1-semialdehyde 2,1-aminomutase [Myxococcales bacterium]
MRPGPRSEALFARAKELFPGGVNSPVRAFAGVGGTPVFFERGEGPWLFDADGERYVDFVGSWGPLILGHAPPAVVSAIAEAARGGTSYGAPHAGEIALAEAVQAAMPWLELVRFVSSGTEATSAALRLARAFTQRDEIVKFDGCYHGATDSLLVKAGSGVETLGLPDSPGVPAALAKLTHTLPFNDLDRVRDLFAHRGDRLACVIVEPVVGNMGVLAPAPGFLEGLRDACQKAGALLVMDEVMTGFRLARGGAQDRLAVRGDLTTFGKVIGGGLPVGAFGGRVDVMKLIAPSGPVYQAGTLSGNPLAMAAGRATLQALARPGAYQRLEAASARLAEGLAAACADAHVPVRLNRVGSMWTLFFAEAPVTDAESARRADRRRYAAFFHAMLDEGVYLPPSQFEAAFVSLAHGEEALQATLRAARAALARPL